MAVQVNWPLFTNVIRKNKLSNTFGMVRKYANGSPKPHQGWDFSAVPGTPCYAIADGKAEFTANQGDYGRQICMSFELNGEKLFAFYAHMQKVDVVAGQVVTMNQLIGLTGKTGNASNLANDEQHLHFEIRKVAVCGLGLANRISPIKVFGICPLNDAVAG